MAESMKPHSLLPVLICEFCSIPTEDARTLRCLHTLCAQCVSQVTKIKIKGVQGIACPDCQTFTPKDEIETNVIAQLFSNNSEDLVAQEQKDFFFLCIECGKLNPTSVCADCTYKLDSSNATRSEICVKPKQIPSEEREKQCNDVTEDDCNLRNSPRREKNTNEQNNNTKNSELSLTTEPTPPNDCNLRNSPCCEKNNEENNNTKNSELSLTTEPTLPDDCRLIRKSPCREKTNEQNNNTKNSELSVITELALPEEIKENNRPSTTTLCDKHPGKMCIESGRVHVEIVVLDKDANTVEDFTDSNDMVAAATRCMEKFLANHPDVTKKQPLVVVNPHLAGDTETVAKEKLEDAKVPPNKMVPVATDNITTTKQECIITGDDNPIVTLEVEDVTETAVKKTASASTVPDVMAAVAQSPMKPREVAANKETSEDKETIVDDYVKAVKDNIEKLNMKIKQMDEYMTEFTENRDLTKMAIKEQTDKAIQMIRNVSVELMKLVDENSNKNCEDVSNAERELKEQLSRQKILLAMSNREYDLEGSRVNFWLKKGIVEQKEKFASQEKMERGIKMANFTTGKLEVHSDQIGTLVFRSIGSQPDVQPLSLQVRGDDGQGAVASPVDVRPKTKYSGATFDIKDSKTDDINTRMPSFRQTGISLELIQERHLEKDKHILLKRRCHRLCYINHTIWCPSHLGDSVIDIYSTDGRFLVTIQTELILRPQSVHPQTDQYVLVAASNGLFRMNMEGNKISLILSGFFIDVHANEVFIVALMKVESYGGKNKVHVLPNTYPFTGQRYFKLDDNNSSRLMLVGDHIYVSSGERFKSASIVQYTLTGEKLGEYGECGVLADGELQNPYLCCYDRRNRILVADSENSRFQVLDRRGQWSVQLSSRTTHIGFGKLWSQDDILYDVIFRRGEVYVLCRRVQGCYIRKYKLLPIIQLPDLSFLSGI